MAKTNDMTMRQLNVECADTSALWNDATCRVVESGVIQPHSKSIRRLPSAILVPIFSILVLLAVPARADTTNFTQAFPGISQATLQSDLENVNTNPAYTPTNLLKFMGSNYFNTLPAGHPWLFDSGTQIGTLNSGSLTATGQVVTAPIVPDQIAQPLAATGTVSFAFPTVSNHSYTVSGNVDLKPGNWINASNFTGDGYIKTMALAITNPANFYRVSQP